MHKVHKIIIRCRYIVLSLLAISMLNACTSLFFFPMKKLVRTPTDLGLNYQDVLIATDDGNTLHGWFLPAAEMAKATVLFLHGNAENISTHIGAVYWLPEQNYNVLLYDYRGYGKSTGIPSLPEAVDDVKAVYDIIPTLTQQPNRPIIVFGQSLGGAIAVNAVGAFSATRQIDALVIESSFANFRQIAREKLAENWFTWVLQWPLSLTITGNYNPTEALASIQKLPILIIHGTDDQVVGYHHAQTLINAASSPKQLWKIPHGQHIQAMTIPQYRIQFLKYLDELVRPKVHEG